LEIPQAAVSLTSMVFSSLFLHLPEVDGRKKMNGRREKHRGLFLKVNTFSKYIREASFDPIDNFFLHIDLMNKTFG
jgi:hypothetical protein